MPRAHWAQRLCGAINDHTAQRTPSACARPDNAAYKVFVSVRMKRALFGE
jgi:hypothetical protein